MSYKIRLKIPHGCQTSPPIDHVLTYKWEKASLEAACQEYEDLLTFEHLFEREDNNKYKTIRRTVEGQSISRYSDFGEELEKKYKNSILIKLINKAYASYSGDSNTRKAMIEFKILQEVTKARTEMLKKTPSQTVRIDRSPSGAMQQNFSQSMYPGHGGSTQPVVHTDQPLEHNGYRYVPETMYKELQNRATIQENEISDFQKKVREKDKELDELRNRLSGFASKQLTLGNPDFADLSDKNRPSKIAEFFHNIYDDEWTSALEALTQTKRGSTSQSEEDSIVFLMEVIQEGYKFCKHYSEKQEKMLQSMWSLCLEDPFTSAFNVDQPKATNPKQLPDPLITELKQRRRIEYTECVKSATQKFKEIVLVKNSKYQSKKMPAVDTYVDKCIELFWLMSVQDPPMVIRWPEANSPFDADNYKEYCRKGRKVKIAVWPAVYLHEKGALMNKGFAMPY